MKIPEFNAEGVDEVTFKPFKLMDARNSKWKDIRLSFSDWDWLKVTYGSGGIEGYYFNGPGVEGLVKAARMDAGLDPEAEGIDYNSEGGTCYIHFLDINEAITTAELSSETLKSREKLIEMIALARENGFDDA